MMICPYYQSFKLAQLKTRAYKHGLAIRKLKRGDDDSYCVVDMRRNVTVSCPTEMPLAGIAQWLDAYEAEADEAEGGDDHDGKDDGH